MNDSAIPVKYGEEQTPDREDNSVYGYEGIEGYKSYHEKKTSLFLIKIKKIDHHSLGNLLNFEKNY